MTAMERRRQDVRRHRARSTGHQYAGFSPDTMDYYSLDRRVDMRNYSKHTAAARSLDYTAEFSAMDYCSMDRRLDGMKKNKYKYVIDEDDSSDDTLEYMELFSDDFDE